MKRKNYYAWICAIWIILTLIFCLKCINGFVGNDLKLGFIFLTLTVSFSFTSGSLFKEALNIARYNYFLKKWDRCIKSLIESKKNRPFKEFDVPFPEVKKEKENE